MNGIRVVCSVAFIAAKLFYHTLLAVYSIVASSISLISSGVKLPLASTRAMAPITPSAGLKVLNPV